MLRWLQLSLFGASEEKAEAARPAPPAPGPRLLRPLRSITSPRSHTSIKAPSSVVPLPETLLARWRALCPREDVDLILAPRLRQGWRIEWRRGAVPENARLRVPACFLAAPDEVRGALGQWAALALARRSPRRNAERKSLEKTLHAWIESRAALDARSQKLARRRAARRLERFETRGRFHDLQAIFDAVNTEYFGGKLEARITWSRRWGGLSTQTHARDADGNPYALLTISRGYDHPSASAEIVGGVVYHECLHIAVPPEERDGRRIVHGREFRRREREYRFYKEWRKWHAEQLPRIIRRGDGR